MVSVDDTIRIEAESRWDAVDLARRLAAHHTYLVQLGNRRWHVCVHSDDRDGDLPAVRETAERWAAERRIAGTLHCGGDTYDLSA